MGQRFNHYGLRSLASNYLQAHRNIQPLANAIRSAKEAVDANDKTILDLRKQFAEQLEPGAGPLVVLIDKGIVAVVTKGVADPNLADVKFTQLSHCNELKAHE